MIKSKTNHSSSLIFLHIHKTAGTSLRKIFERFYFKDEIYFIYKNNPEKMFHDITDFKSLSDVEKKKIKVFYGHLSFGLHNYIPQPCYYVTVLRDPIERILSLFWHLTVDVDDPRHHRITSEKMSVADLVQSGLVLYIAS